MYSTWGFFLSISTSQLQIIYQNLHYSNFTLIFFFTSFNASIIIDSSVIKNYIIPIQASLAWPSIVEQSVKFPSTYVGNFTTTEMLISNPSDHPLVVQVVPLLHYPQPEGGLDLLSDRLIVDSFSLDLNGHSLFSLPDIQVSSTWFLN